MDHLQLITMLAHHRVTGIIQMLQNPQGVGILDEDIQVTENHRRHDIETVIAMHTHGLMIEILIEMEGVEVKEEK